MANSSPQSLVGYVGHDNVLTGTVSPNDSILSGALRDRSRLTGNMHIGNMANLELDSYSGPYDISPSTGSQVLNTKRKILTDYITVYAIPYVEKDNEAGGKTITIG